ncbi:MAG TPA: response regulator [Anaerolineales bacterium]|nr:response regulator [Anaerolineales bacterium]
MDSKYLEKSSVIMPSPASEKLKILVVDDDEMNRRMMSLILSREDHHVELATGGFEACKLARDQDFDIILMDLQMPEMDGVEASRQIRASENGSKDSYIVALTASYLPEKGEELFEAGIDNYIAKPFDLEHLRLMLRHGLDHRLTASKQVKSISVSDSDNDEMNFNPSIGLKQVGGDEEMFHELLADFVAELPQKLENMKKHLDEKDMDSLSRDAHNLKGVSSNLGVLQLSQHAGRLENSSSEGYTKLLRNDLKEIKAISENFIRDASKFLAEAGK